MQNEYRPIDVSAPRRRRDALASVVLHGVVLAAMVGVFAKAPQLASYKLPGTKQGVELLTYYAPGSKAPAAAASAVPKVAVKAREASAMRTPVASARPAEAQPPKAEAGAGTTAQSGLGEGDISIALSTYFPHPRPDLSTLPHGTRGDVVLDAVIDENGKIAKLTLLQGLGSPVDDQVIATVKQWTYTPAKKNGTPVPSEQELHFHYERG